MPYGVHESSLHLIRIIRRRQPIRKDLLTKLQIPPIIPRDSKIYRHVSVRETHGPQTRFDCVVERFGRVVVVVAFCAVDRVSRGVWRAGLEKLCGLG